MNDHQAKAKLLDIARRLKDEQYRKPSLTNEQNTKNWIIVPTLMSLGWDVHSPDVYSEDAGGISSKVDYGLRIEGKVKVFIEAKALGKTLDDKDAEQASNYANNKGVAWCVLTNGQIWRVYKSSGAALPERLLFEVELLDDSGSIAEAWQQLRHLARASVQNGELDRYANRIFIDNRLRDVLKQLLQEPTQQFLNALQKSIDGFTTKEIRESLKRLSSVEAITEKTNTIPIADGSTPTSNQAVEPNFESASKKTAYTLESHLNGKTQQTIDLFHQAKTRISQIVAPQQIEIFPKKQTVGCRLITRDPRVRPYIADLEVQRNKLKMNLPLDPKTVGSLPVNGRDVSNVGHWGTGNIQFSISSLQDLEAAIPFITLAYQETNNTHE